MTAELGIYQVVLSDEALPYLDPAFLPFDWRTNPTPELREIPIHAHFVRSGLTKKHRLSGVLSVKFYAKTGLTAADTAGWIAANPGYEVYLISGHPYLPYWGYNSLERGSAILRADLEQVMRKLCARIGIPLPAKMWRQTNLNSAYSSYFVATEDFWSNFHRDVISVMLSMDDLGVELSEGLYSHAWNATNSPPVFLAPLIYERIISLYVSLKNVKALYYPWSPETILNLRISEEFKLHLAEIMPKIDVIDKNMRWNEENMGLPLQEYLNFRAKSPGPIANFVNSADFNIPSVACPQGANAR